ncbi:MAG TPA: tRNA lysidine(34) synthetase TilS, partial [bacterium]|nr:tRNA lysidine(34) synthetase TilS [bacterium]
GMQKEKKLSRFLIDRKIPVYKRDKILIFQSKNEIMWVCGVEISEKFKITEETKKILKIKVNV